MDLSYLVYRQLLLPFDEWYEDVRAARNSFASKHGIGRADRRLNGRISILTRGHNLNG